VAIHLDATTAGWERPLRWAYRILALLWVAKGLFGWAELIGFFGELPEFTRTMGWFAFFVPVVMPIVDIIAGVSLWISWRWGAGVWTITALGFVSCEMFGSVAYQPKGATGLVVFVLILHFLRLIFVRSQSGQKITVV